MISFTTGNLLEAGTDALVNTVNTVGVMGKGIALMFKEAFPENFKSYAAACKNNEIEVGRVFITERSGFIGPRWIVNFPTKAHWRFPSKLHWIADGLTDLKSEIKSRNIRSIAFPPLGAGNGGLEWDDVKALIVEALDDLEGVSIVVYEPTDAYQNVEKRNGVEKLTPPRAVIAELVRRYSILGIQCSLLEIQKLAYFAERFAILSGLKNMNFQFEANRYGPYSERLRHLLDSLDGSYLHCTKRLSDAGPFEAIRFDDAKRDKVGVFFSMSEAKPYRPCVEATSNLIDGLESPLGMELLATVDWLISERNVLPTVDAVRDALKEWPGGKASAKRKLELFEDRLIDIALDSLQEAHLLERSDKTHAHRT